MTMLRWLHLTDLHIDKPDDARRQYARELFHRDLERLTKKLGPWDLVLFTGDLAFSGRKEQYDLLDGELDELWELFRKVHPGAAPPLLLAVPGNHDLARPPKGNAIAGGLLRAPDAREALWNGDPDSLAAVQRWFAAYEAWWRSCRYRPTTGVKDGLLPGDFAYVFEKEGASFGFIGMNSAFLDLADEVKARQLWTDVRQVQGACGGDLFAWIKSCSLAFLLTHHPPSWLNEESLTPENPASLKGDAFAAHLCGHLHEAYHQAHALGGGATQRLWQSTSLFGVEKLPDGRTDRKYGYSAGEVSLDVAGASFQVWPRLAAKLQDGSYRITADFTFALEDDLAHTAKEMLSARSAPRLSAPPDEPVRAPASSAIAPSASTSWAEAVTRSPLWEPLQRKDAPRAAALQRLAAKVADAAFAVWNQAEAALPGNPWRDDRYPLRVLDRLAAFVLAESAGAEETLILLLAPFVREAVLAAGAAWMATAKPLDLDSTAETKEPRVTLEQVHRSREDLLRHAARIQGPARDALAFWMMEHALQRSAHLWQLTSPVAPLKGFVTALERGQREETGGAPYPDRDLLFRLARAVDLSPDALEAEGGLGHELTRNLAGGGLIRVASLAYLLSVAGAAALDLRAADEVAVDHVGGDAGVEPSALREAIRVAAWSKRQDRVVLAHVCAHPVIDFVLRDLVERAEVALERTRLARDGSRDRAAHACALLAHLPARLSADGIEAAKASDGRPLYTTPHLRFRLDHQRIRELLMGEQLYGDPTLAVRELYQNALDACRYHRARSEYLQRTGDAAHPPYEGRIAFRQAVDERGRTYIECEDNGVGMTRDVLARVFAVAGKRFHDMPDFLEERAKWQRCSPPVELYPNSQFGVGVLSYFMLADEVTVWTRRFEASGALGEPLVLHIASASGLFRLEEGREEEIPEAGTRVRLYLAKTEYQGRDDNVPEPIACTRILGELLWVAEFPTTAESSDARLAWEPNRLTMPPNSRGEVPPFFPAKDPDVWWCIRGRLLCDGISTTTEIRSLVINLRGPRSSTMSIDRKEVIRWDPAWVHQVIRESGPDLVKWNELSLRFIWELESDYPDVANQLAGALSQLGAAVRLSSWPLDRSEEDDYLVADIGIFPPDDSFIEDKDERVGIGGYDSINVPVAFAWRLQKWWEAGAVDLPSNWPPPLNYDKLSSIEALPVDAYLLMIDPINRSRFGAGYGHRRQFSQYAFESKRWLCGEMSLVHIIAAARRFGLPLRDTIDRVVTLSPLGVRPPQVSTDTLECLVLTEADWITLSQRLDGNPPWADGDVTWSRLLRVSENWL